MIILARALRKAGLLDFRPFADDVLKTGGIDPLDVAYARRGILKFRTAEESGETYLLRTVLPPLLPPNATLFDVGANVGKYSAALASTFPHATVHAFEPNPAAFAEQEGVLGGASDRIQRWNLGLGEQAGSLKLYDSREAGGSSHASLHAKVLTDLHGYQRVEPIDVRVTALDEFCDEHGIETVDFLKIDTEGHELAVLRGAGRAIAENRLKLIQFEFNEMNVVSRCFLKDFFDVLPGYEFYRLDSDRLIPLSYHPREEIFQFQNVLAATGESAALLRRTS